MLGEKWVKKVDRWGQWVLLGLMLVYFITGFAMTRQVMNPEWAKYLHTKLLALPLFFFFFLHTTLPLNNQFRRWKFFGSEFATDLYTYAITGAVFALLVWLLVR